MTSTTYSAIAHARGRLRAGAVNIVTVSAKKKKHTNTAGNIKIKEDFKPSPGQVKPQQKPSPAMQQTSSLADRSAPCLIFEGF